MKASTTGKRQSIAETRRKGGNQKPDRLEWDFSTCPPEELYECYCYEYARESKEFREDIERFRKSAGAAKTFDALFEFASELRMDRKTEILPQNTHRACIFNFSPEFPDRPFLSIEGKERRRRVILVNERFRGGDWMGALMKFQPIPWDNVFHWGREELERRRKNPHRKIAAFDMDWTLSEPELEQLFCAWVRKERKRDGSAPRESRGAGGSRRQYETWLKQLSVLRLCSGMRWEDAALHSEEVLGKPLYRNQANWITAKRKAKERAELFSKESF